MMRMASVKTKMVTAIVLAVLATLTFIVSPIVLLAGEKRANADIDIPRWILCDILELQEPINMFYAMPYTLMSKSAFTSGLSNVDEGLNALIEAGQPKSFRQINKDVIGYDVASLEDKKSKGENGESGESGGAEAKFNKGPQLNPYDRFGVAGMTFSTYGGEWKYYKYDYCSGKEPEDTKSNLFYQGRVEPKATFFSNGLDGDVRTQQWHYNPGYRLFKATLNTLADWVFSFSKLIVALTLAFVNFSFSDVVSYFGLNDILGSKHGVFNMLFENAFMPMAVAAFLFVGVYVVYKGMVKREIRQALSVFLRSLVLFIIAIIGGTHPDTMISLPNNVSVAAQSFILSSMSSNMGSGDGICASNLGKETFQSLVKSGAGENKAILESARESMRSIIGCQFWQALLLNPWSEGQFGVSWNDLWADGKVPAWAKGGKTLGNTNGEMVGDAAVPIGNGKFINNWAIFQISTQTNVHTQFDSPGSKPRVSNAVSNDWYRIVDALSNYSEKEENINPTDVGDPVMAQVAENKPVSPYWKTWIGDSPLYRLNTAVSSVLIAGVGVSATLFFSAMCVVYALGVALIMGFAPLMMLLGLFPGHGWDVFKGWASLLVNTVMARIAFGLLLVLAVLFTTAILKTVNSVGWWQAFFGLILVSILLIKSRHKIVDALASFDFGGANLSETSGRLSRGIKSLVTKPARFAAGTALSAGVAGATAARHGGGVRNVFDAVKGGVKNEIGNEMYKHGPTRMFVMNVKKRQADKVGMEGGNAIRDMFCAQCGAPLAFQRSVNQQEQFVGGVDNDGNYLCEICFNSSDPNDVRHINIQYTADTAKVKAEGEQHLDHLDKEIQGALSGSVSPLDAPNTQREFQAAQQYASASAVIAKPPQQGGQLSQEETEEKIMAIAQMAMVFHTTMQDMRNKVNADKARYGNKYDKSLAHIPPLPAAARQHVSDAALEQILTEDRQVDEELLSRYMSVAIAEQYRSATGGDVSELNVSLADITKTVKTGKAYGSLRTS